MISEVNIIQKPDNGEMGAEFENRPVQLYFWEDTRNGLQDPDGYEFREKDLMNVMGLLTRLRFTGKYPRTSRDFEEGYYDFKYTPGITSDRFRDYLNGSAEIKREF